MITRIVEENLKCSVGVRDGLVAVYLHTENESTILLSPDQAVILAKVLLYWAKALTDER